MANAVVMKAGIVRRRDLVPPLMMAARSRLRRRIVLILGVAQIGDFNSVHQRTRKD